MANRRRKNRRVLTLLTLGIGLALMHGLTPAQAASGIPSTPSVCLGRDQGLATHQVDEQDDSRFIRPSNVLTYYIFLPLVMKAEVCQPVPGESYSTLSINGAPTDRPAEEHADLNLALRGYEPSVAFRGLVTYGGGDPSAPQLPGLFSDKRTGVFDSVYQVYDWDWGCNCRGDLLTMWPVTLAGLASTPGETIHVPDSGYAIGSGYEVLVLYASSERITLKYTRDDNVIQGYTLHVENVCVEPSLLALYHEANGNGRASLPALRPGQALGRARSAELGVAIRDNGSFMDPRSRSDWWQGR